MTQPVLHARVIAGTPDLPLLVVLPSLGTAAEVLWAEAATLLAAQFQVLAVDLPGHGGSAATTGDLSIAELASAVITAAAPFAGGKPFHCAGVSIGGTITLQLMADHPSALSAAVVLNSAAKIGTAAGWTERAALVRENGTAALRAGSEARWFAPGFATRDRVRADALLATLEAADDESYAGLCTALAGFDLRESLAALNLPLLVIGGEDDLATPPADQRAIAAAVPGCTLSILPQVAHLAPAEAPEAVARLIADFCG